MLKPKIIKWMTYEDLEQIQKKIQIGDAMYRHTPEVHEAPFDEFHQDVLIQELVKNNYIICGDTHQNFAIPIFNDGFLMLSMRRWAGVMNQAYGNQHNFYMAAVCDMGEKLPVLNKEQLGSKAI